MTTEVLIGNRKYVSSIRVDVKDISENKLASIDFYAIKKQSSDHQFVSRNYWVEAYECRQAVEWCQDNLSAWSMYQGVFYMSPEDLSVFTLRWV